MSVATTALVLLGLTMPVSANTFLRQETSQQESAGLLDELERVLGTGMRTATEKRVQRLEEVLRPTFLSMPKDADGALAPDGVRYLLHRIFVDRHGWYVRGLGTTAEAIDSSPADVFKQQAANTAHDLFENRLGIHGFNLHHVAVLAATLETFVYDESIERLRKAYDILGMSPDEETLNEEHAVAVIDSYMMMYVLGVNHSTASQKLLRQLEGKIGKLYPVWNETRTWVHDIRKEVMNGDPDLEPLSFKTSALVVQTVGELYGRWQDKECRQLKDSLLAIEEAGTGRVRVDTFYKSALEGTWQFSESVSYLRQMGALDDSTPNQPKVIIPNYINAPSNCVASSRFYSVCCIDECEALLVHLETRIAAPDASPARIAEIVADLPSATVGAPRDLASSLVNRLEKIAEEHGGVVPLHSRLFAQWMHHAYPRECSYPHLSGTSSGLTPRELLQQGNRTHKASVEEMRWHIEEAQRGLDKAQQATYDQEEPDLPWSPDQELFVQRPPAKEAQTGQRKAWGRGAMLLFAAGSMMLGLFRTVKSAASVLSGGQMHGAKDYLV